MTWHVLAAGEEHGEKGKPETDDLKERREWRDDQHPVKKRGPFRQEEHCRRGEEDSGSGEGGANSGSASVRESKGENSESCDREDDFRRREFEELEKIHGFNQRIASTAGRI
jgi:hypothetical protein